MNMIRTESKQKIYCGQIPEPKEDGERRDRVAIFSKNGFGLTAQLNGQRHSLPLMGAVQTQQVREEEMEIKNA